MARRGFSGMTALRAALGAATGIGEGLQQREVLAEAKRQRQLLEARQKAQDEAEIRNEQRQAITSGMVQSDTYNPYGIAGGMDMPGATPRQPVLSQNIGGMKFVLPESPQATKHRAEVLKELDSRAKKKTEQTNLTEALSGIEVGGKALFRPEQAAPIARLPGNIQSSLVSAAIRAATPDRGGKPEIDDDTKRLIGAQYLASNVKNPALMRALNATYARNPAAPLDPELTAYSIMKSKTVPAGITANKGYTPAKPKAGDAMDAMLAAEIERRKGGGAAKPAATPAAAPAATPPTAQVKSQVDNELTEQRRLWDQAVAKHGRDKVIREFGERP